MKIICAGVGKTGTKSIAKALRHLGLTVFDWEEQTFDFQEHWVDVFQNGAQLDVKRVYQHADAIVDAPGNFFWEEILEAYPDSKVILSEREEDSWLKSVVNQLQVIEAVISRRFLCVLSPTSRKQLFVLYSVINALVGSANPKAGFILRTRYREHNHRVKSLVPPEKLLVYNVKQGWEPLCDFLGCEVPTIAFPNENIKGEIAEAPLSETRSGRQIIWEIQRAVIVILSVIVVIVGSIFVFFSY
ncbi:unnamed protein product [Porites evermanni]|uniref:Uncharacterized protein n=1 Tax=Porites evermanni TaxID=104178 RepID=A0ABN8PI81_9CNID|nr:unnamed protein product [Porites evermanni]